MGISFAITGLAILRLDGIEIAIAWMTKFCLRCGCGVTKASLTVFWLGVSEASIHGGASVTGIVAWADGCTSGCHLCISGVVLLLLLLPESALAGTRCVVVVWTWAICLLLAVMTDEEQFHQHCEEEEEDGDDRDGKDGCLESAGAVEVGGVAAILNNGGTGNSCTKRGVDEAAAFTSSLSVIPGNSDEAADKEDVEEYRKSGEECNAGETDGQKDGEEKVEYRCTRHALNSFDPGVDGETMIVKSSQEVREDGKNNSSATELERAKEDLGDAKNSTAESHVDDGTR